MAPKSKKARKQDTTPATKPNSKYPSTRPQQPPDWPPLTPLIPPTSLFLETHTPSQILLIHNLFTSALCNRYTSFLSSLQLTTTPLTKSRDLAVRVNDRFQVDDALFASQLWSRTALKDLILNHSDPSIFNGGNSGTIPPEILGLNPNIRIYRYRPGQFFDKHYDDSNDLFFPEDDGGKSLPAKTTWTLLIYLSTCEGGETVFYPDRQKGEKTDPEPVSVAPEVGLALLHRHGDRCMLHEGRKVTTGEKWVLRSDLVVRR